MARGRQHRAWRVLVAADASRGAEAAFAFAAELVSGLGAALTVITVADAEGADPESASLRRSRRCLALAGRTLGRAGIAADLELVEAEPGESIPDAIQRAAERLDADLVVIGSEGRDTLREWVMGGVALRLLYLATRPVVVVRPPRRARGSARVLATQRTGSGRPRLIQTHQDAIRSAVHKKAAKKD